MNAKATPANKYQTIPVKQLEIAPDNIRKTPATKAEDQQLKASIRNNGVILPLVVKAAGKGKFHVHAGGRRLEQTKALIKEKELPASYTLTCIVAPKDANTTEISLIENTMQAKMHPVDLFEAFSTLHQGGVMSPKEIAIHFGRSENSVKQLLALAAVHPELRDLCRSGKLTVESLQAYAVTDNQSRQLEAYEALRKQGGSNSPHFIRSLLTENTFKSSHKYVKFITLKAYRERGGESTPDLFQGETLLHNAKLVESILIEKLDAVSASLLAEGWKWAEIDLNYFDYSSKYGRQKPTIDLTAAQQKERTKLEKQLNALDAEKGKLEELQRSEETADTEAYEKAETRIMAIDDEIDEIDNQIAAIDRAAETYSDRQKATGGCIITLNHDGKLEIYRGLTRKDEQAKGKQKKSADDDDDDLDDGDLDDEELEDDDADGDDCSANAVNEKDLYTQAVYDDLACYHLAAAKTELLYSHELMHQFAQFAVCWQILGHPCHPYALNLTLRPSERIESSKRDIESGRMHQELNEYREKLDLTWISHSEPESFRAFQALDPAAVVKLVGYCMTVSLQKITLNPKYSRDTMLDELLRQAGAKLAKHWRPSAENFFTRINNNQRLDIAHQLYAPSEPPASLQKMKKGELSTFLEDRVKEFPPAKCWMPPGFTYIEPSEDDAMLDQLKKEAGV